MTQAAFIRDSDTFKADDVQVLLKMFYKKYKENIVKNCLLFFLRYPLAFFRFTSIIIKEKKRDKQTILNILQHKNYLFRDFKNT